MPFSCNYKLVCHHPVAWARAKGKLFLALLCTVTLGVPGGCCSFSCSPGISPAQLKLLSWMVKVMKKIRHTWKKKLQMKAKTAKHKCFWIKKKGIKSTSRPHREAAFPHSIWHKAFYFIYIHWNLLLQDFADDKLQCSCKFFYTFQLLQMSKVTRRVI